MVPNTVSDTSQRADVSVVVPTRNRSHLLPLTLRSVLAQRGASVDLIVVDDASTDNTASTVMALKDPRVRMVRHDLSRGVSASRNRGIAEARADWVAFLDDDDLWAPSKLSEQLKAQRHTGAVWGYTGHVNVNIDNRVTGGAPPKPPAAVMAELPRQNVIPGGCSGVIVDKRVLAVSGVFNEALQPLADWDLWLRLAEVGTPACVAEPLTAYRVHGHQMSLNAARIEEEFPVIAARSPEADAAVLFRYLAWWALRVNNHRDAVRFFSRAFAVDRQPGRFGRFAGELGATGSSLIARSLRLPVRPSITPDAATLAWRNEGQAWIDALLQHDRDPAAPTTESCRLSR